MPPNSAASAQCGIVPAHTHWPRSMFRPFNKHKLHRSLRPPHPLPRALLRSVVNTSSLVVIGYGFGGTGAVDLALAGYDGSNVTIPTGVVGVASFHGGITATERISAVNGTSRPRLLLESGGKDDSNADVATLIDELEAATVAPEYEISRYVPFSCACTEAALFAPAIAIRLVADLGPLLGRTSSRGQPSVGQDSPLHPPPVFRPPKLRNWGAAIVSEWDTSPHRTVFWNVAPRRQG